MGAQMGATEQGGKKSRRLFSSLRPWKATRRLWRTRSAPKAAQGECGRGRGTCYYARRAPATQGRNSGRVLRPRTCGRGRRGQEVRPGILHPDPRPREGDQSPSSPGAGGPSAGSSLGAVPAPSPPLGPIGVSRWLRCLQLLARKSRWLCIWRWMEGIRVLRRHILGLHPPPRLLPPSTWQAPALQCPLGV